MQTRYKLDDVIARGGMAEVYRAHDTFLGRDVAVKVFHASATAETDFQRQQDEVNVLARLSHPNLVTLLDAAVDRSDPAATRIYYVMELVEGTDLKRRLDEGPLVARQIAQIGYYTASALEYVHAQGIVHRDVKPANILLTYNDDGSRVTAKLGDFGVASIGPARAIGDDEIVTGTVAYLSPEQARGEEVGPASDVYALGLVLLQCFTGELAFPGPPQHSATSRLLDDPAIPDAVPGEWVPLLRAMTAKDARDRPDVHDVAIALRQMFAAATGRHKAEVDRPANEADRLKAVYSYELLSTPPDDAFDRITSMAARVLRTPVAIVSVVDHDRIWFTSAHGTDITEIARDPGLCASAILSEEPWIIEDARTDPRALDNPLVAGDFGLQFYAGVPLTTPDGFNLGTLCVLDFAPRTISEDELATLSDLAAMVMRELELRREMKTLLQGSEAAWLDSPDTDEDGTIITNRASTGPIDVPASIS
jgi:eukaryotic-like serine/threonine-protein kinase